MHGWKRAVFGAVISLALGHTSTLSAQSCPCGPVPSPKDALHASAAVFEGYVQTLSFLEDQPPVGRALVRVVRAWKGIDDEQVSVLSPPLVMPAVHDACTFAFEPGESYLVYALKRTDGQLELSTCGRTRPIAQADEDLAQLGMGSAPVSAKLAAADAETKADAPSAAGTALKEPPARGGCASCNVHGDTKNTNAALPALLVLGIAAWRVRLRRATKLA